MCTCIYTCHTVYDVLLYRRCMKISNQKKSLTLIPRHHHCKLIVTSPIIKMYSCHHVWSICSTRQKKLPTNRPFNGPIPVQLPFNSCVRRTPVQFPNPVFAAVQMGTYPITQYKSPAATAQWIANPGLRLSLRQEVSARRTEEWLKQRRS